MRLRAPRAVLGLALIVGSASCDSLLGIDATFVDASPVDAAGRDARTEHTSRPDTGHGATKDGGHDAHETRSHDAGRDDAHGDARDAARDGGSDAGHDAPRDGAHDAPRDGAQDAARDTGRDAPRDGAQDAARDTGRDAPRDGHHPPHDARHDALRDAGFDAPLDAGRDATLDAGRDASLDAGRDAPEDATTQDQSAPDAGMDAGAADAGLEADTGPACTPVPDFNGDPNNCGRCGHDCLGGACKLGACQPFVVTSLEGYSAGYPNFLVVTQGRVYWGQNSVETTGTNLVLSAQADGGNAQTFWAVTGDSPYGVAVDSTNLYWLEPQTGVFSCPLTGCTADGPHFIVASMGQSNGIQGDITSLSVTGGNLYTASTNGSGAWIWTCPTDADFFNGSAGSAQVTSGQYDPISVYADDAGVVWANQGAFNGSNISFNGGGIFECPPGAPCGTSQLLTLDTLVGAPQSVTANATYVFWTAVTGAIDYNMFYTGNVVRCNRADCQNTAVAYPTAPTYPQGIAIDETRVYWADIEGPAIVSCPIEGCADAAAAVGPDASGPMLLATDGGTGGAPFQIALDDNAVYWTNKTLGGKIMKVAKP